MSKSKSQKGKEDKKKKKKSTSTTQERRQHARGLRILEARKDRGGCVAPRRHNKITEFATKESMEAKRNAKYVSTRGITLFRCCSEARPRERNDRGRFPPIGKKASSYRGAYRVPLFN